VCQMCAKICPKPSVAASLARPRRLSSTAK